MSVSDAAGVDVFIERCVPGAPTVEAHGFLNDEPRRTKANDGRSTNTAWRS